MQSTIWLVITYTNTLTVGHKAIMHNKEFLCITHTVEHNYISPSCTVGIPYTLKEYTAS